MAEASELAGKVALITGGARNIGRAIASALAAGGAAVMVNARSSREDAQQTVSQIEAAGGRAALHMADVTEATAVAAMVESAVARFGRLDILFNSAALRAETPLAAMTLDEWRRVLSNMLDGSFLCAQACAPHLARAGSGAIVNIGGLTAHTGASGRAHVVTAKAGITGLTRALALELAPQAITVNCVVPGTIETVRGLPPVGRRGEPAEVAATVRFLCGPGARYITGQSLHVSGGGYMA